MEESVHDTFYYWWWQWSTADLLYKRYMLGIAMRCTYPRPAFPDYLNSQLVVVNRILSERGEA